MPEKPGKELSERGKEIRREILREKSRLPTREDYLEKMESAVKKKRGIEDLSLIVGALSQYEDGHEEAFKKIKPFLENPETRSEAAFIMSQLEVKREDMLKMKDLLTSIIHKQAEAPDKIWASLVMSEHDLYSNAEQEEKIEGILRRRLRKRREQEEKFSEYDELEAGLTGEIRRAIKRIVRKRKEREEL